MAADEQKTAAVINHVAICVADQDASVAFYQGAFGLQEIPTPLERPRWFDLGGGVSIHIIPGRTKPVDTEKGTHLALQVPDLDPVMAYFTAHNISWSNFPGGKNAINVRPDGVRQIFVQDPDGYWVEINDAPRQTRDT